MTQYRKIKRPKKSEYPIYSQHYFDLIKTDNDILSELHDNFFKLKELIYSIPEDKLTYRYEAGKWTIKEILVHNIDDERIFSYRALRYARNDNTPISGFNQDEYVKYSNANERTLEHIFDEYEWVRRATISLFQYLPEASLLKSGSGIDENGKIVNKRTVRAIAYHIAGHELNHIKVIKERYLDMEVGDGVI